MDSRRISPFQPDQVLVVIPTLNEARHIADCLRSLILEDPFGRAVTCVVADGGSTDGTQDIVTRIAAGHRGLHLMHNPDRLQSAGINAAIRQHRDPQHALLVRCDAHAAYPPNYIQQVVTAFADQPEAASVATVMDAMGTGCFQRAAAWVVDTPLGAGASAHRGGTWSGWVDHGHHAGMRLEMFEQIGGYDPGFSHNEDAEYDHRLQMAGGRVWLAADIRLGYQMRPTPRQLWRQYWNYGRGRARTLRKHGMRPRLRQVIPVINLILLMLSALGGLIWPAAWLWAGFYLATLMTVSAFACIRMRSPCGLWAGPALAIIHNAWGAGFLRQILH